MSITTTSARVCGQKDEFVTDWRVVGSIVGLVLVMIVAGVAARSARRNAVLEIANRKAALQTAAARKEAGASFNQQPVVSGPLVGMLPWMSSGAKTPAEFDGAPAKGFDRPTEVTQNPPPHAEIVATPIQPPSTKDTKPRAPEQVEYDLRLEAHLQSIEISIDQQKQTVDTLVGANRKRSARPPSSDGSIDALLAAIATRPDLDGLPLLRGSECRKEKKAIPYAMELSRALRPSFPGSAVAISASNRGFDDGPERELAFEMSCVRHLRQTQWQLAETVSTWLQITEASSHLVRLELIKMLASINGREGTAALVNRAMFDLSAPVRLAAIEALKSRQIPSAQQQHLLRGLRYPWEVVADNSANAIIALRLRELLPQLTHLAEQPNPDEPFLDADGNWRRTELVRVNHFRNCVLCHAVSTSSGDPIRGFIPEPGKPLPTGYYDSHNGDFVRADVTYLRQDFSLMQPVPNAQPWPELQRFDYFLRTRFLTSDERRDANSRESDVNGGSSSYPQRDAVLRAIKSLTTEPVEPSAES
jgi:hypothetical protein